MAVPRLVISTENGEGPRLRPLHPRIPLLNPSKPARSSSTKYGGTPTLAAFPSPLIASKRTRRRLDIYTRVHLTEADFRTPSRRHAELPLAEVNDALFHTLNTWNPLALVIPARFRRLRCPPGRPASPDQEKHISLKLSSTRSRPFKAVAWRSAERFAQSQLLAGDTLETSHSPRSQRHPTSAAWNSAPRFP